MKLNEIKKGVKDYYDGLIRSGYVAQLSRLENHQVYFL